MSEQGAPQELGGCWEAPHQAGRRLGVTTTRVGQLVAEGQLKALRTPLGRLIDVASVDALVKERQARLERPGRGRGPGDGR